MLAKENYVSNNHLPSPLITQGRVYDKGIELRNLAPRKITKQTIVLTYNIVQDAPGGRQTEAEVKAAQVLGPGQPLIS